MRFKVLALYVAGFLVYAQNSVVTSPTQIYGAVETFGNQKLVVKSDSGEKVSAKFFIGCKRSSQLA